MDKMMGNKWDKDSHNANYPEQNKDKGGLIPLTTKRNYDNIRSHHPELQTKLRNQKYITFLFKISLYP